MEIHCGVSKTSSRLGHLQLLKQIDTSSLKIYQILFSMHTTRTKITTLKISLNGQDPYSVRLPTHTIKDVSEAQQQTIFLNSIYRGKC
jgi:type VI protein secretion system component Hcp